MKIVKYLLILTIFIGASQFVNAQTIVHVKIRPTATVVERAPAPHRGYVWVGDEWAPHGATYTVVRGHWVAPRRGFVWVPGHWVTDRFGDYWVRGHWRRA